MSPDEGTFLRRREEEEEEAEDRSHRSHRTVAAAAALMALTTKKFEVRLKTCPPSGPLLILAAAVADNRIFHREDDTAEIPEGEERSAN